MSASVLDMGPRIIEGLHHPSAEGTNEGNDAGEEIEREKEPDEKVDPKVNAAKMGMYGPLTREVKPWVPAKLLCKRFGVREPDVSLETKAEDVKPGPSTDLPVAPSASSPSVVAGENAGGTTRGGGPRDITNLGLGEDETQGRDILTYQRPGVDVFKAIFASDDEDEDEGDEEMTGGDEKDDKEVVEGKGSFTSATVILDSDEPVDPETFKPRFVPRKGGRDKEKKDHGGEGKGEKKEKKDRKEKKRKEKGKDKKVLVSFELDEGDFREPKENRPAKKRRKERGGDGHGSQEMDTSPSAKVNETSAGAVESTSIQPSVISNNPGAANRGRKRAVDFMD